MAYQTLTGPGMWLGGVPPELIGRPQAGALASTADAAGEMVGFVGRVWFPARTGTKAIQRVQFMFGTVDKAGGSGLTVSLQDVDLTAGPPARPDGTQDQTVAIANADAGFVSNTWYRTGTLSADRTVTYGDLLAVVIEYDGTGWQANDDFAINSSFATDGGQPSLGQPVLKTGGTWALAHSRGLGSVLLEMSDGTFGILEGNLPIKAANSHNFKSDTALTDEFAMPFTVPFKCKIDALRAAVNVAAGANFELILYTGTTATVTVSVDANTAAASALWYDALIPETELAAGTQYYVAIKPTTTTALTAYSFEVENANHLTVYPGGPSFNYTTRVDGGAWAAATATRRLLAGVRMSAFDDGAGSGGGASPIGLGSPVIRAAA